MYEVMTIDSDVLERQMIKQVLCRHLNEIKNIIEADNGIEAMQILQNNKIDILMIDISHISLGLGELIQNVRLLNPNALVILTSVKTEKEICHAMVKLKADTYLLKPYSPNALVTLISKYIQKFEIKNNILNHNGRNSMTYWKKPIQEQLKRDAKLHNTLQNIKFFIQEHFYKKSIDETKRYIDIIYDSFNNRKNVLGVKIIELVDELVNSVSEYNDKAIKHISIKIDNTKRIFEQYNTKYNAYREMSKLIGYIFKEIDKDYEYTEYTRKILNYIDQHIQKDLSLNEIASFVNMNPCYFSKFFKKEVGVNFITYVTNARIEMAKEMLKYTNLPIVNISCELSYNETNYFCRAFKKKEGMTPTQYREKVSVH